MLNFNQQKWYNKNDSVNKDNRIPISADHLNRIEEGVAYSVGGVNNMFNHWWEKSKITRDGGIIVKDNPTTIYIYPWSDRAQKSFLYYSKSVSVKVDETTGSAYVQLNNATCIELSYDEVSGYQNTLSGNYFMFNDSSGYELYYMESGGYMTKNFNGNSQYGLCMEKTAVVSYYLTYGEAEYVSSDMADAYPNGWDSRDETLYKYLGVPYENARDGVKIETGSYVGTGLSGLTLNFSGEPCMVVLQGSLAAPAIMFRAFNTTCVPFDSYNRAINYSWRTNNDISCNFNSEIVPFINSAGTTYNYMAITL